MHVIFVALSVEDTAILSVDLRILIASFTAIVFMKIPSLVSSCTSLASQTKLIATAVQVNSATSLIEEFTGCGEIVISCNNYKYIKNKNRI